MTNYIWVTTSFEGIHKYPKAPKEVSFLRHEHRHIFHIKIWIEVFHNDREIEFILFKRYIQTILKISKLNNMSCETIANYLYNIISVKYPRRDMKISVDEDEENGCEMEYPLKNDTW